MKAKLVTVFTTFVGPTDDVTDPRIAIAVPCSVHAVEVACTYFTVLAHAHIDWDQCVWEDTWFVMALSSYWRPAPVCRELSDSRYSPELRSGYAMLLFRSLQIR